jgi:hypothetical protein
VDIRSRANTTRGLDYEHIIKVRAHKEGVRIGKTPKKLELKKMLLKILTCSFALILFSRENPS